LGAGALSRCLGFPGARDLNDDMLVQGCFEAIHYTGAFEKSEVAPDGARQVKRKLEKIDVSQMAIARLLPS
jgi:hypothetical protein